MKLHMLEKLSDLSGWMARKLHMLEKLKKKTQKFLGDARAPPCRC